MTKPDWELLAEADHLFRKMVRKFVKERDKITIEGITLPGLMILHQIEREGEQRLSDLAEQLDFTSGAITALCDRLEDKGFAVRKRMKEDRRTVLLDITDRGREMLGRNDNIGRRCMEVLFEGVAAEDLVSQMQAYRRIIDNLERFSETILKLAKENAGKRAESSGSVKPVTSDKPQPKSTFLSY